MMKMTRLASVNCVASFVSNIVSMPLHASAASSPATCPGKAVLCKILFVRHAGGGGGWVGGWVGGEVDHMTPCALTCGLPWRLCMVQRLSRQGVDEADDRQRAR